MSLVAAKALSLAFGPKVVLDRAALAIGPHDRIGLVGANGTGKSSLLRILAGEVSPDSGELVLRRGARAGYLPQDVASLPDLPLVEAVLSTVPGRTALEARLAQAEAALASAREAADQLELSQALAELHEELDHFEEHFGRRRAERILGGLGFSQDDLARPARTFSGGWKMRAALAGLLLQDPDLLLLDEPTNHLDVPTLEWFDAFLRGTRKALVLVSHDREFLNRQIDRVLALEPEGLRAYAGDYDDYRRQRAGEEERLLAQARRQAAKRAQLETFIERFGAKNTKASQARSKEKQLERMEEVQVLEHRSTLRFSFPEAPRSGKEVLRFDGVSKGFGERAVYRGLEARVLRGERVGVIGPNGAGKTTLFRMITGQEQPDAGSLRIGETVQIGYVDQSRDALSADKSVWEEITGGQDDVELGKRTVASRAYVSWFNFKGRDQQRKVGALSGGERNRVHLAKLLKGGANLLLLDEPTNDLDVDTLRALEEALLAFAGCAVVISHDRWFLDRIATHMLAFEGDSKVEWFEGNYQDYEADRHRRLGAEADQPHRIKYRKLTR